MAYHRYDLKKPIAPQLNNIKSKLKELEAMNKEIGIQALYQNHSGKYYFGAPLWDVYQTFQGLDPNYLGLAFDTGHTTIEGGKSWPIEYQLLKPFIQSVYVKDPTFKDGKFGWAPLGEGIVSKQMYSGIKKDKIQGPINLHVEYLSHKDPANEPKFKEAFKRDIKKLRTLI